MTYNAIMDAAYDYRENVLKEKQIKTDTIEPVYDRIDLETAFREGLLWFKEKLWHKPEETPEANTTILYEYPPNAESKLCYATMEVIWREYYSQYIAEYPIRRWCYVNDLI